MFVVCVHIHCKQLTNLLLLLQILGSLVEVSMPQNGIYHEGISALADAFGHNHGMEVCLFTCVIFVTDFCQAGSQACLFELLCAVFGFCYQVINLSDNTFAVDGSVAMANALPSLQQVRVLNFGDCLVRNEGARAIAKVIQEGLPLLEVE